MTAKGKELMKETVENLKKLDKESMILVKASIDILIARQRWTRRIRRMQHNRQAGINKLEREEGSVWKDTQ